MNGGLAYLGLAEAAELIRTKKLSPVEYVTALLARIERYDAKYNAFIALTPERALTAARSAEAEIAAGRRPRAVPWHALCAEGHHRRRGSGDHGAFQSDKWPSGVRRSRTGTRGA
jgi:hypothetical protein